MRIERGIMKKALFVLALVLALAGCSKSVSNSARHLPPPTSVVTTTQPLPTTTSTLRGHNDDSDGSLL